MPKVKDWGLSDTSEPDDLDAFEPYDGEDPPKGVYKFRMTNFRVKANRNDDPMLNGMLVLHEDRPAKKQYNGWTVWFNENVTDVGKPFVKRLLNALGVSWSDLMNNTVVEGTWPKTNGDDPAPISKMGKVKFSGNDVMVRASIGFRKDNAEELEVKQWLPWKDDEDEDSSGPALDEPEADEPEADEEPEDDTEGDEEWTREALEELEITGDDPEVYSLTEILDEQGTEYDDDREDAEYYIALILEEEPPPDPRQKKAAAKKGAAKKTAAKKGSKAPF